MAGHQVLLVKVQMKRCVLGPLLADIFMVEPENTIVPSLNEDLSFWKRYDDDIYVMLCAIWYD